MLLQAAQQPVQVRSGEVPVERHGSLLVAALEGQQASFDLGQVGEVVGRHDLALHDREVDLDLVQPRGVHWQVELPLSTTQYTRSAEQYGSTVMTCSTSRPNGSIPVVGSQRPNSRARWTSHAAR